MKIDDKNNNINNVTYNNNIKSESDNDDANETNNNNTKINTDNSNDDNLKQKIYTYYGQY